MHEPPQRPADVMSSRCPSRRVFERVTSKWTPLVLHALDQTGPARFSDLARAGDGISDRLLAVRLRELEEDGWVDRVVDGSAARYGLSDEGRRLARLLDGLVGCVEQHVDAAAP